MEWMDGDEEEPADQAGDPDALPHTGELGCHCYQQRAPPRRRDQCVHAENENAQGNAAQAEEEFEFVPSAVSS